MPTCPACINPFNKTTRKPIKCPNSACEYEACKACYKTFIKTTQGKRTECMECKAQFTYLFMVKNISGKYVFSEYRDLLANIWFLDEMKRIEYTMFYVPDYKKFYTYNHPFAFTENPEPQPKKKLPRINKYTAKSRNLSKAQELKTNKLPYHKKDDLELIPAKWSDYLKTRKSVVVKKSIPCSTPNCIGAFNPAYPVCPVCNTRSCFKCGRALPQPDEKGEFDHTCDPELIKSLEFLAEKTKPCPNCQSTIYKVEGCDDMFCVACMQGFKWSSGALIRNTNFHNPDLARLRDEGRLRQRSPGDVVCGGVPNVVEEFLKLRNPNPSEHKLISVCKFFTFAINPALQKYRNYALELIDLRLLEPRLQYILKIITEAEYKKIIGTEYMKQEFETILLEIFELIYEEYIYLTLELGDFILKFVKDQNRPRPISDTFHSRQLDPFIVRLYGLLNIYNSFVPPISVAYKTKVPIVKKEKQTLLFESKLFTQVDLASPLPSLPINDVIST
nr:hypothetical protein [Abalone asfa-like virus]